jgi:hypothetical protein
VSAAAADNYSGGLLFNFFVLFVIVSHPHNKLLERNLKEDFFPQFDFCIVLQLKKSQSSDLSDWTLISTYGSSICNTCIYMSLSVCVHLFHVGKNIIIIIRGYQERERERERLRILFRQGLD